MDGIYDMAKDLPGGWSRKRLGDILSVVRGASPRPKGDPRYFGGAIPWIMISDITKQKGKYVSRTIDSVTEDGAKKSRFLPAGTLILSNSGTVCVPKILAVDGCIHDGFVAFPELPQDIDIFYLYYFFDFIRPRIIDAHRQGITQVNLNTKIVKDIQVPVPPVSEQRQIVAEIEKQFSRLDETEASLRRVKANLKRYKAAVLKAAVEGRLVETEAKLARREGRTYETGEQLLQRILQARRSQWKSKGKYKEAAASNIDDLPELPEGWVWVRSEVIFDLVTSGSRGWAKHYSETGSAFLRVGNLDHGTIDLDLSEIQHVSPPLGAEADRSRVQPGDLLISITAELGMVAVVPGQLGDAYINQHVALARPTDLIDRSYLGWYFACEHAGKLQLERLRRGATKAGLGLDDIRSVFIALPPVAEQKRIVAEVNRRFSLISELAAQIYSNVQRAGRLRQAVLGRAFVRRLMAVCTRTPDISM